MPCSPFARPRSAGAYGCSGTSARRQTRAAIATPVSTRRRFSTAASRPNSCSRVYIGPASAGALHLIDVLRGEATPKVAQRAHDNLSVFGIGRERNAREWRAIVRQCISLGLRNRSRCVRRLQLAGESRAVLKGERSVALRAWREPRRSARVKPSREALSGPAHELFERLRAWRVEAARRHGVPAYVIFHDATLREIARMRPSSLRYAARHLGYRRAQARSLWGRDRRLGARRLNLL